jgi:hypothetical protein
MSLIHNTVFNLLAVQKMEQERLASVAGKKQQSRKRKLMPPETEMEGGEEEGKDERKCLLCGAVGDRSSELAGRLLFYRYFFKC